MIPIAKRAYDVTAQRTMWEKRTRLQRRPEEKANSPFCGSPDIFFFLTNNDLGRIKESAPI
jgi:hypothetical protein